MPRLFMINACLFSEENLIDIDSWMICSILTRQTRLGTNLLLKGPLQHPEFLLRDVLSIKWFTSLADLMELIGSMIYTHLIFKVSLGKSEKLMVQNQLQDADIQQTIWTENCIFLEVTIVTWVSTLFSRFGYKFTSRSQLCKWTWERCSKINHFQMYSSFLKESLNYQLISVF